MSINYPGRFVRSGALVVAAWLLSLGTAQAIPPIQHWQTTNGVRVYYMPAPELPMVDIRVVFAAGSAHDANLPGLASMTNHLLDKGAAGLTANDIALFRRGAAATMTMAPAAAPDQRVTVTMSLSGFTAAFEAARRETSE